MPTRLLSRALLVLLAVIALLALLVGTTRLRVGETVLLPGTESKGVRLVSGAAGELSLAVDVRNGGLLPIRIEGAGEPRLGPYAARLGRGRPGGGVPEEPTFAPFLLWPGQQRLVVLHLTRKGEPQALDLADLDVAASVFGVGRTLRVELPTPLQVTPR